MPLDILQVLRNARERTHALIIAFPVPGPNDDAAVHLAELDAAIASETTRFERDLDEMAATSAVIAAARAVNRGCDCGYDHRCSRCVAVVALKDALLRFDEVRAAE